MADIKFRYYYRPGDILDVYDYDQGDDSWRNGKVEITKVIKKSPNTTHGIYRMTPLTGNFNCSAYNAETFQSECYIRYLGNVHKDKALRVLYGK